MQNINDLYLLARAGDSTAENQLFKKISERFRLFLKHKVRSSPDTDDIIQDCCFVIKSKYRDEERKENFSGWAYTVLQNKLKSYYHTKATKANRDSSLEFIGSEPSFEPDYQLLVNLKSCLKEMKEHNPRYLKILTQTYQGYSVSEITERLEISANGLYILLSRARTMLKKCLKSKESRS